MSQRIGSTIPNLQEQQHQKASESVVCCSVCECAHLSAAALMYLLFGQPELAHSLASMCVKLFCITLESE